MGIAVRASDSNDSVKVQRLIMDVNTKYFGCLPSGINAKVFYMGYQSHRFIAYEKGDTDTILAYAEIRSFPNICALSPQCWTDWLNYHYCIDLPLTLINTLFFNLYIFKKHDPEVLPFILREVFLCENRLRYLITVKPPMMCINNYQSIDYNILEKYTISYYPIKMSMTTNRNTQMVYIALRDTILPYISFRKALPEDNDDIIEIIDYEEPELREELGDYFIAEELLRQDEEAKMQCIIVGEVPGKNAAILNAGFMWLSDDFKIENLIKNFHLESFGNLLICDPKKPYVEYHELVKMSVPKPYIKLFTKLAVRELHESVIVGGSTKFGSIAVFRSTANFKVFVSEFGDLQTTNEAFFQRSHIFEKFQYIYEEFLNPRHYVTPRIEKIPIRYNVPWNVGENDLMPQDAANFFILNKFNLHPKQRMETTFCFLSAAFSAFPERDYLLVRIRPEMKVNECLNEILHYCLRVTPRPDCNIPYELYLTHRSSLFGEICLFDYCEYDTEDIERLMDVHPHYRKTLTRHSIDNAPVLDSKFELCAQMNVIYDIMEDVLRSYNSKFRFFTIRCGNSSKSREETTFIGFVVIREMTCYSDIGKQYMLTPDTLHFGDLRGEIIVLKLHPFFHVLGDELFRMLANKTDYFDFFHITKFSGLSMPNDLKKNMMPIEPRRFQRNWFGLNSFKLKQRYADDSFGLPYIDGRQERLTVFRHNLLKTKFFGNKDSIVILGFSDYAKCFLRCLVFSWNGYSSNLTSLYNCVPLLNVTVIVNDGIIESVYDNNFSCDYCDDIRYCYISHSHFSPYVRDCSHRIDLRNWVHFVSGRVEFIDRVNRTVNLSNKCRIRYDKLILMCHTEFGIDIPHVYDNLNFPYNFSQLNSRLDRIILYHKVQELCQKHREQPLILLYGNNISTFACIQFLLTHGVGPDWLELVKPRCKLPEKVMTDSKSDESVQNICTEMIIDMGVKVIEEATFVKWILYPDDENFISHVRFKQDKNNEIIDKQCDMFINFNEDYLLNSYQTMLLNSGIKLRDKKIIIDENYCTNDPRIYAMGRFMEMKYEPNYQYLNTNQMEAAEKLMHIFGLKFHKDVKNNEPFDRKYYKTYTFRARLPKYYQFFKVTIPRRFISPEAIPTGAQCSFKVMTTYRKDLCRIGLNKNNLVEQIMVLSKKNEFPFFLEFLCGKHEALLNNILRRFETGLLSDFVEFFNEPWTELFMHDMFDQLQIQNIEIIKKLIKIHAIDTTEEVDGKTLEQRKDDFINEKSVLLENNLIQFIKHYQRDFVNDFALPQEFEF